MDNIIIKGNWVYIYDVKGWERLTKKEYKKWKEYEQNTKYNDNDNKINNNSNNIINLM